MAILLSTEHFLLRPLTEKDITSTYISWLNDPTINRFLECRFTVQTEQTVQDYLKKFDFQYNFIFGLFDVQKNSCHIGNFTLVTNPFHHFAELGFLIGDKTYWGTSAATEGLVLLFDFAFLEHGIRKITGGTYHLNIFSISKFQKLGFTLEGVLREKYQYENHFVNELRFGLLKKEWLEIRKNFLHTSRKIA